MKKKTGNTRKRHTLMAMVVTLVTGASCQTLPPVTPGMAAERLKTGKPPRSFAAQGRITLYQISGAQEASAKALLAIQGEWYRLQIVDDLGRGVAAIAGDQKRSIVVDPATGRPLFRHGADAKAIKVGEASLPVAALPTLVTGAPPRFGKVVKAEAAPGGFVAQTADPLFFLGYRDGALTWLSWESGAGRARADLLWSGPASADTRRVVGVTLTAGPFGKKVADLSWDRVDFTPTFPHGYFSFHDDPFE